MEADFSNGVEKASEFVGPVYLLAGTGEGPVGTGKGETYATEAWSAFITLMEDSIFENQGSTRQGSGPVDRVPCKRISISSVVVK